MLRSGYVFGRVLAAVMAALAPLIALHGYTLYQQDKRAEALAYDTMTAQVADHAKAIAALLHRSRKLLDLLAARTDLTSLEPRRCAEVLGGMSGIDPLYANFLLVAADGSLVCAAVPPPRDQAGRTFAGQPWFTAAMASDGAAFGRPYPGFVGSVTVSALTVPLRDPNGQRLGLVAVTIDLQRLAELELARGLPPGGSVTVVDPHDMVISRFPDPDRWIGQSTPRNLRALHHENPHGVVVESGADGVTRAYARAPVGLHGLRVTASVPTAYLLPSTRAERSQGHIAGAVTLLLATALACLLARAVARPIQSLGRSAKAWASGARGARADEVLPGEFRTLGRQFNMLIDAREASETRLIETERRHAAMLDGADLIAISVALDGRLVCANHALSRLTGWSTEELLDGHWTRLVLPPDSSDFFARLSTMATRVFPVPPRHEGSLVTRDGHKRQIRWSNAPLRSVSGELIGITSIGEDLTEWHQAELAAQACARAEAANQAKTEFLAHVSHELRTPLAAVLGFSELLQRESSVRLDAAQRHRLALIHLAGVQLRSLIDDMLDASQIDSGRLAVNFETVDLMGLVEEVIKLSGPNAQVEHVNLEMVGQAPAMMLRTDPVRLRQVLLNLLSNGIKYNRPGGHVCIATRAQSDVVEIEVNDNGLGMSAEQLGLFDRLGHPLGPAAGMNIGMSLSRQFVWLLGGELIIDSVPGRGTRATVRLKGSTACMAAPAMQALRHARRREQEPSGTVLYIEDNVTNTLIVQELLAPWPRVRLLLAPDGHSGIALARQNAPDLVLLDMRLPDLHGIEVLAALRMEPRTAAIPVVSLSASAMPEEVDAARAAGATAYWTKPLEFAPFLKGVSTLLAAAKRSI